MEVLNPIQIEPVLLRHSVELIKPPIEMKKEEVTAESKESEKNVPVESKSDPNGKEEIKVDWKSEVETDKLEVDWSHILPEKMEHLEACEINPVEEPSDKILELVEKLEYPKEMLSLWQGYFSGNSPMFSSKDQIKNSMKTIVDYCEKNDKASPLVKHQLRFVTKLLHEPDNGIDAANIIVMMSAHGNACNVQKEVGVRMAYAAVTDTLKAESTKQSIETAVLLHLLKLRVLVSEQVYMMTKQSTNVHYIVPFQNKMSKRIGLHFIPDPDEVRSVKVEQKNYEDFVTKYNPTLIIKTISEAVNHKPRKVPYEPLIEWYQANPPADLDPYEFLESIFNESGSILPAGIAFFLRGIGVLKNPAASPKVEKAKSPTEIPPEEVKPVAAPAPKPAAPPPPPAPVVAPVAAAPAPAPVVPRPVVPQVDLFEEVDRIHDGLPVWGKMFMDEVELLKEQVKEWDELPLFDEV